MEPQLPTPDSFPEMNQNKHSEQLPSPHQEVGPVPKVEQQPISVEQRGFEQQTGSSSGGDPSWQAPVLLPSAITAPAATVQTPTVAQPQQGTPLVAKDDDLIEQEWVQRAKKIVEDTKNDPYLQEREVSRLQADYLQKRYGKELKLSSE